MSDCTNGLSPWPRIETPTQQASRMLVVFGQGSSFATARFHSCSDHVPMVAEYGHRNESVFARC
jgi:hypothetical protein